MWLAEATVDMAGEAQGADIRAVRPSPAHYCHHAPPGRPAGPSRPRPARPAGLGPEEAGQTLLRSSGGGLRCGHPQRAPEVPRGGLHRQQEGLQILLTPVPLPGHAGGRAWLSDIQVRMDFFCISIKLSDQNSSTHYLHFCPFSYTESDHYYSSANLRYYQPNVYHYHSTPWHYR